MKVVNLRSSKLLAHQVRVKMVSSKINWRDIELMKGVEKLEVPRIGGSDGAGQISEKGSLVQNFQIGDGVFFYRKQGDAGTWAEEITINSKDIAKIPENVSVRDSGAIIVPVLLAYEALCKFNSTPGKKILIHGAASKVGFQAVQLAWHFGLKVYATANFLDYEGLLKAGVSEFFDKQTQSFEREISQGELDYIFDPLNEVGLSKSIKLKPKKVIFINCRKLSIGGKVRTKLTKFTRNMIQNSMHRKHQNFANRNGVELTEQGIDPDGNFLQEVSEILSEFNFKIRPYEIIKLNYIEQNGLNISDLGKIIKIADEGL